MTTHLSTQEFVDAVDRALPADRLAHLAGCAACQSEVEGLCAVLTDVDAAGDLPEPSPLFWDHFQMRVRAAALAEPAGWSWRAVFGSPRTILAAGVTVAAVVIGVSLLTNGAVGPGGGGAVADDEVADASVTGDMAALDGMEWEFVTDVMSSLGEDEAREVLAPSRHAVDAAFEALTTAERDAFISLLTAEMEAGSE